MKKLLCLKPKSFLICLLFFSGIFYSIGQVSINSEVFSDQQNLSPAEQLMLRQYLENYDNLTDLGNGYPPIWDNPIPQQKPHGIIVALESNPRINDIPLDQNDYIGGFYTDDYGELRCGGASYWPDTAGIVFALQGDNPDTPEKDGFSYNEIIYFKLFSFSTMKDYMVDVVVFDPEFYGTNKWGLLGLSRLLDVQALEDLDFYIQPSNNPICFGDEITLSAQEFIGSGGNYTFQWSSNPPGFNYNVQFPPPVTPLVTTTYTLLVDDGVSSSEHSLTIEVSQLPIADAGTGGEVCANADFQLSGDAQNFTSVIWTTEGDGEFNNAELLNALYTPGETDIINGEANLILTAIPLNPCEASFADEDEVSITVLPIPVVSAGDDFIACTTQDVELFANAYYYSTVQWSTSGSGYFTEPNSLNTLYIAQGNDFANGVNLTICAQSASACEATVCDVIHVSFVPGPTAYGMSSTTGCENNFITVGGQAFNFSSTQWTTAGDGTFANPGAFLSNYYPGTLDIQNEGVIVTLNAYPIGNCDTAVNNVIVNIVNLPKITFGPNSGNICFGDDFLQLEATVNFSNSIVWSTNGDGTFSNTHITNPKYFPGIQDEQNGQFELELFAYPLTYCSVSTIEPLLVTYQDNPMSFAGPNGQICENETYTFSQASASSYSQLLWSGGNGAFSNPYTLKPTYTPAPQDYGTTVTLCLEAAPISPCDLASSDCMNLYVERLPETEAGPDKEICETDILQLDGTVLYYDSFEWTTSGDGVFSDANTEDPSYIPGSNDIESGLVTLTLTAQPKAPCAVTAVDEMQLDIQLAVTAAAGNDNVICDVDNHPLLSAFASNYETIGWTTSGDGTFSNPSAINPIYYPGIADINTGNVGLTITATAVSPCAQDIVDTKTLGIVKSVEVNAGFDFEICETETHQLSGNVENELSFVWTTNGDGQFNSPNIENPVYTPGPNDKMLGTVTLTLTAQPNSPCQASATDFIDLDIQLAVTAAAGNDNVICDVDNHPLLSAFASNYETIGWTTSGDGTFSNPSAINPIYYPGIADINTGNVGLTITATAVSPCAQDIVDTKTLGIVKSVEVNAGFDFEICETETHQLSGNVENELSFVWTTNGDGQFSNAGIENPVYTPGPNDKMLGTVALTLTAQPNSPCQASATDFIDLDIQLAVTAAAGDDNVICDVDNHPLLSAFASNYETIGWTTSGDGTFSNPSAINPIYYPGIADINTGNVELTITATAVSPCAQDIVDIKTLGIIKSVLVNAGSDFEICETETHQLSGTVENELSFVWTTNGDGQFSNAGIENPIYTPGPNDKMLGTVALTLTAQPNSPCQASATDGIILDISPSATLDIGEDFDVCATEPILLDDVVAAGYSSLLWTTSGDGTFNDPGTENPLYYPGDNDLLLGLVELNLTLSPVSPCIDEVSAGKMLSVAYPPNADAGQDITSCGDEVELSGSAENYSSLIWTTAGDGTFDNAASLSPVYYPGETDIDNQQVQISLIAEANLPCTVAAEDMILINFDILTLSDDNVVDKEVVAGNNLFLSFSVNSLLQGQYSWYFNGEIIPGQNDSLLLLTDIQPVNAGYYQGKFTNLCGTVETNVAFIEVLQPFAHEIVIPQGWSGLSSYVSPDSPELETVFSAISDNVELMANYDGIYWPGQNINTLGNMEVSSAYQIKMTESATLTVVGNIRYPLSELVLSPGWSYLPVNTNCVVNIENQFGGLVQITMIKEIAGTGIYWPEQEINTIGELQPGKAYFILNESATEVIIKYAGCE